MSSKSTLPKSILKNTSKPFKTPTSTPTPTQEVDPTRDRHYATALHHANLIQQQKDLEKLILDALLSLLDLPKSPTADPASPAPQDAKEFKELVANLRPQDYDDLIEERNASSLCGYALCPRKKIKLKGDAKFKLVLSKENGLKPVAKKELERWCSHECARRALYIKVQLIEEPAWTKQSGRSSEIDLMIDTQPQPSTVPGFSLPFRPKPGSGPPVPAISPNNLKGTEKGSSSEGPSGLVRETVVEKRVIKGVAAPSLENSSSHTAVEGYEPKDYQSTDHKGDEEEDDRDWDI